METTTESLNSTTDYGQLIKESAIKAAAGAITVVAVTELVNYVIRRTKQWKKSKAEAV